jgi:hypothetical protein
VSRLVREDVTAHRGRLMGEVCRSRDEYNDGSSNDPAAECAAGVASITAVTHVRTHGEEKGRRQAKHDETV